MTLPHTVLTNPSSGMGKSHLQPPQSGETRPFCQEQSRKHLRLQARNTEFGSSCAAAVMTPADATMFVTVDGESRSAISGATTSHASLPTLESDLRIGMF